MPNQVEKEKSCTHSMDSFIAAFDAGSQAKQEH